MWPRKHIFTPAQTGENPDAGKLSSDLSDISELLSFGVRQGMLKPDTPVPQLAHGLVDLLYGQMLCWSMSNGTYSLKERTREFCDTCLEQMFQEYCSH